MLSKLDGYVKRLEDEMRNIQVFKCELPHFLIILKDGGLVLLFLSILRSLSISHQWRKLIIADQLYIYIYRSPRLIFYMIWVSGLVLIADPQTDLGQRVLIRN